MCDLAPPRRNVTGLFIKENENEMLASHSITSSARARRPSLAAGMHKRSTYQSLKRSVTSVGASETKRPPTSVRMVDGPVQQGRSS